MKVAIDQGTLVSGHAIRGIGVHTRELIGALKKLSGENGVEVDAFSFDGNPGRLKDYAVVHYPYFHPFFLTLPAKKPAKKVVLTIHDLIPLIYPKQYPPGLKGKARFLIQKQRLKNVDAIVTISETSKKDICRFLGVNPNIVHVVYLAAKEVYRKVTDKEKLTQVRKNYKLPDNYVLYVGDVNYNKNIPNLIKACRLAKLPLVIAGKQALDIEELGQSLKILKGPKDWARYVLGIPHPQLAHYESMVREFKKSKDILRLGFVPDEDIIALYNLASVFVQPSFYEGFGLPVLEAMACGTPVVAARTNALVEVGGDAALYADPHSPEDMAEKIKEAIKDRANLSKKGIERARNFSWKKVARETLEVYKNA